ncbi:hypothetical protein M5K25_020521 [Dendrobium thyrsiflorum]|uniref:Uncharacterized protein n=1 Tax=Dendrobium thyrsiflorum TaxID=117978 RepID=A0ABD0UAV3_DENTH
MIKKCGIGYRKGTQTASPRLAVLPRQFPFLPASKGQLTSSTLRLRRFDPRIQIARSCRPWQNSKSRQFLILLRRYAVHNSPSTDDDNQCATVVRSFLQSTTIQQLSGYTDSLTIKCQHAD